MRKVLIALLCCLIAISGSAFAGGSSENQYEGAPREFEGKTLTLMIQNKEGEYEAQMAQVRAFEEKYGCTVEVEVIPTGTAGENLRMMRIATHALPDIFGASVGALLVQSSPVENCYPLNDQPWIKNVDQAFLESGMMEGNYYAVPTAPSNVGGVFYNKNVFAEHGIEIPETWDEFLAVCDKLKNEGVIPVAHPNSKQSLCQVPFLMNYYYVEQEDPKFAEKYTRNEVKPSDNEAFVGGFQKLYDLVTLGYLNEDAMSATVEDVALLLADGDAAMSIIRTNILTTINELAPDKVNDIGFFPLPDKDPENRGVATWLPIGYFMSNYAKEPELALKFLEFMTTSEAVNEYVKVQKPTGAFMLNGITFDENADVYPALVEAQEWVEKSSTSVMEYKCPIKGSDQPNICSQVAAGMITPEEAVQLLEQDDAISARQQNLPGWG